MPDTVISAEHLSKKYLIGHARRRQGRETFREMLLRGLRDLGRSTAQVARGRQITAGDEIEEFWALDDVSFEVGRGEVLGIIGPNGAGKSTLLKVLSRITEPTKGRLVIDGRVASLLEVGTGFHSELSGRENIFLNGAILGMTRREVRAKFDEIVDFAEIEKFIDTPVKRYSSGMYVRLAFAVAAHLDPEILLVDEVLAVGDADFQKKCMGKMSAVASGGRTVLFVSHNMGAIATLCDRGLLLRNGKIAARGDANAVIAQYVQSVASARRVEFPPDPDKPSIVSVEIEGDGFARGDLDVTIEFQAPKPIVPVGGITLRSADGFPVWGSNARLHPSARRAEPATTGRIRCQTSGLPLTFGPYTLSVWLSEPHEHHDYKAEVLTVTLGAPEQAGLRPPADIVGSLDWEGRWSSHR